MKINYDAQKEHRFRLRFVERQALLFFGDFLAGILALIGALYLWGSQARWLGFSVRFLLNRVPGWFYLLPLVWLFLLMELYDIHKAASLSDTLQGIITAALIGSVLYLAVYFTSTPESLPRTGVAGFVIFAVVATFAWRYLYIQVLTSEKFLRRVLLVGGGVSGKILLESFNRLDPKPFNIIGIIDDDPRKSGRIIAGFEVLGDSQKLLDLVREENITDIIVAITGVIQGRTFQALLDAQGLGVEIIRMPVAYEDLNHRVPIRILGGGLDPAVLRGRHRGKRLLPIWQTPDRSAGQLGGHAALPDHPALCGGRCPPRYRPSHILFTRADGSIG